MALLSTGAARLSTIVYSRAAPLPLLSLLFFANDAIICSSKNRLGEPVFLCDAERVIAQDTAQSAPASAPCRAAPACHLAGG